VIPHAFGQSEPWSVGIEEELFVLEAGSLSPAPFPPAELDGVRLKHELFASVVELNTGVCSSVEEATRELATSRTVARGLAAEAGLALAACGTWPTALPEEQAITEDEGFRRFVEYAGPSARRQYCSGLHIHVGVASPEACMEALEAVLPWLPLVLAVSANSPYVAGRETGLASARAEILSLLPRSGAPPVFGSYAEWEAFAERLLALGLADEYTRIWWDVRPHPRFGTLEVRMPDQPTRLEDTAALAGLVHALVRSSEAGPAADRGAYAENRWAAFRFGREARLIHPDGTRLAAVAELLDELAGRLGAATVDPVRELDQAGEQVRLGRSKGVDAVCGRLVELT
jgi:glutamate---cysteine ligase / carboxylate-amine ligase